MPRRYGDWHCLGTPSASPWLSHAIHCGSHKVPQATSACTHLPVKRPCCGRGVRAGSRPPRPHRSPLSLCNVQMATAVVVAVAAGVAVKGIRLRQGAVALERAMAAVLALALARVWYQQKRRPSPMVRQAACGLAFACSHSSVSHQLCRATAPSWWNCLHAKSVGSSHSEVYHNDETHTQI